MSRKYKFRDPEGLYFVTFTVVGWVDIFTRDLYRNIFIENLEWYSNKKGLVIHAWVLMTNHVHLIVSRKENFKLEEIMRDLKEFTSNKIITEIKNNPGESRKEWMLRVFSDAGEANSQNTNYQFWQHGNHPIELDNAKIIDQKLNYIHENPVKQGFVNRASNYPWSSAGDYEGIKGLVFVEML